MPFRRKIRRVTMGKDAIKKAGTLIAQIGPSTNPVTNMCIAKTDADVRVLSGGNVSIRNSQDINEICNIGDIIKYVNIRIQTGPQDETPEDDTSGWLEWAVVKYKERFEAPSNTLLGVETLGTVCTRAFRGDCLLTGAIPVGGDQPSVADIIIKIPKIWCKMQLGSELHLFVHFRSTNAASTSTTLNDCVMSFQYKNYV